MGRATGRGGDAAAVGLPDLRGALLRHLLLNLSSQVDHLHVELDLLPGLGVDAHAWATCMKMSRAFDNSALELYAIHYTLYAIHSTIYTLLCTTTSTHNSKFLYMYYNYINIICRFKYILYINVFIRIF